MSAPVRHWDGGAPRRDDQNGTIHDAGSGMVFSRRHLDGVTYQGTLDLSAPCSTVFVKDGITLTGQAARARAIN